MPLAYPTYAEIAALVSGTIPAGLAALADAWANAAVGEWNQMTGIDEYLATADTVRRFDPPRSPLLKFDNPLLSLTSVVVNGATLSASDYYLQSPNRNPYWGIRFARIHVGLPQSVVITGKWGGILDSDTEAHFADARMAILQLGAAALMEAMSDQIRAASGLVDSWKEDDVSENLSVELATKATNARTMAEQAAKRHRWMGVWH